MENKKYSLMLVCNENGFLNDLKEKFKETLPVDYMGNFSETALFFKIAEKTKPEISVIDFEKIDFDDIDRLEKLKCEGIFKKIIILSKNFTENHMKSILSDIADFIVYKPYTDDDICLALKDAVFSLENGFSPKMFPGTDRCALNKFLHTKITETIRLAGIPAHILGYNYLRTAVLKCVLDADIFPITKKLYPQLALEFGSTSQKVERAIRHAIDVGWTRSEENTMKHIFGYSFHSNKCKLSNR